MRVIFRTDASVEIGSGHLMRCLTLADQLSLLGCEVAFICRDLPGAMFAAIEAAGYPYQKLVSLEAEQITQELDAKQTIRALINIFPKGVNWLVVDHYQLDAEWEVQLSRCAEKILVIDDIADRKHNCDLLLDQNYYIDAERRYRKLVPNRTHCMLGPTYVLLRKEFIDARKNLRDRCEVRQIMVFFGGSDPTNQTQKVIDAFRILNYNNIHVDIIVGSSNPHRNHIEQECKTISNLSFHCQVPNMSEFIMRSDLALGAGGASMWERCYLGLPTITVIFAANQQRTTEDVAETGAIEYLGWADKLEAVDYAHAISKLISDSEYRHKMSMAALKLIESSSAYVADMMLSVADNNHSIQKFP